MLYEEMMMDSSTLLKFKLFKKIMFLGSQSYPIAVIASDMNLNYQQTVIDLTDIDKELAAMNPDHQSILLGGGKINCQNLSCTMDEYRYQLLKSSVPFQFILYFLNEEAPTIDDFCVKFYASRSTVSRKIAKLKRYLKDRHLRFTYTEAGMSGDERVIRLALFDLLWLGVRSIEWPFTVSEETADRLVEGYAKYFPLARTYVGRHELKFFAAIFYQRIQKNKFVRYDQAYNFLMEDNSYYDFTSLKDMIDLEMTDEQLKAESSFIFFLAHLAPFYTLEDDATLKQTIKDFAHQPNPVIRLVRDYLDFAKQEFFADDPKLLDYPIIMGNLINISFGYYIIKRPFPTIQQLVEGNTENLRSLKKIENTTQEWFYNLSQESDYTSFITEENYPLIAKSFTEVLLPFVDLNKESEKVIVGIALEHNYLLVKKIYSYLSDLRFVEAEPFDSTKINHYDLAISSSLLLKKRYPQQEVFLWDHAGDENQLIALYKRLRQRFIAKNE